MRYERKVHARLEQRYGLNYVPNQWFAYLWRGKVHYCQTDGLLVFEEPRTLLLLEVKYSHTPDAYWQIEHLYLPVLQSFLAEGGWKVATAEVVKWFDPAVQCPRRPILRERLEDVKVGEFAVHILNRDV